MIAGGYLLLRRDFAESTTAVQGRPSAIERLQVELAALAQDQKELKQGQAPFRRKVVEPRKRQEQLRGQLGGLRRKLAGFRAEVAAKFSDARAQVHLSHSGLDERLQRFEQEPTDLRSRVDCLEDRFASS